MEPKTKIQKKVVLLSSKLPDITEHQKEWAFKGLFDKYATRSRKTLFCFECGHSWKDESVLISTLIGCTCPNCKQSLKMKQSYTPAFTESEYMAILTVKDNMQVVRMFYVSKKMQKLNEPYYFIHEVMQHWIEKSGDTTTLSKIVMGLSNYYDQWVFSSNLEVRHSTNNSCRRYNLNPYKIYPNRKILPIIKRNGFMGKFYGETPHGLFSLILRDKKAETLLKTGQIDILREYNSLVFEKYWPAIKICIRNGYIIKDAKIWIDFIDLLIYFNKDLHNATHVCPDNLMAEHDRLVEKKRRIQKREKLEKMKADLEKANIEYREDKGQFFDIQFSDGTILISVIDSVVEMMEEGDDLHHCVFTNEYYKKSDSLILSARKDRERLETVEVSLKSMDIIQSRGMYNKNTEYHDQIVNLVRKNINVIQKIKRTNQQLEFA